LGSPEPALKTGTNPRDRIALFLQKSRISQIHASARIAPDRDARRDCNPDRRFCQLGLAFTKQAPIGERVPSFLDSIRATQPPPERADLVT